MASLSYRQYIKRHGIERMPDRGFAIGRRRLGRYEAYFLRKQYADHAAQLLANEMRDLVDVIQIQDHGNTRFVIDEVEPRQIR